MKLPSKSNLNKIGILTIAALFILSIIFPTIQMFAKAGALIIYAAIVFVRVEDMKKKGEETEKTIIFEIAVSLTLGYLFFFA